MWCVLSCLCLCTYVCAHASEYCRVTQLYTFVMCERLAVRDDGRDGYTMVCA